ncbi:MAG: ABC transporter ATP-binding protein [Reyranellaceae bacterium]
MDTMVAEKPGPARPLPALAVEVKGLSKRYKARGGGPARLALDNVDLAIPRGSIYGLLGPNGAGKSTLINILAGLVVKSAGSARIWDIDIEQQPRNARAAIGVVPQELNLDPFFTPRQALELQAGLYGVPPSQRRTMEILEAVRLTDKADSYARTLSGGMRRRLLVAKALVHNPPVLVLDEPTAGVDIELRQQLWAYVRQLNANGTTVLLTTHYLEEAQELCDRVAIIHLGKVTADDTTRALLARLDSKKVILRLARPVAALPAALGQWHADLKEPTRIDVSYRPSAANVLQIVAAAQAAGLEIADLATEESDLEDAFVALTQGA